MGDLQYSELMASIQSQGMALSEWADAQPEPWATVLRFLPICSAFLLGLILVLLWKKKSATSPVKEETEEPSQVPCSPESQPDDKLPLLKNELKLTLQKNQRQKVKIESAKRALDVKDQQLEELKSELAAAKSVEASGDKSPIVEVESAAESGAAIEMREDLQDFALASEQVARAAVDFRNNLRQEASSQSYPESHPTGVDSKTVVDWDELLLFRSRDPSIWNQNVNETEDHFAASLDEIPDDVAFLRLRRLDSGQGILIPLQQRELKEDGGDRITGFNGSNEEFYGARHLGIYSESLSQEVEIRFALGGWGFGHAADSETDEAASPASKAAQACAWAGQKIDSETVIEITVFPRLPDLANEDQLV